MTSTRSWYECVDVIKKHDPSTGFDWSSWYDDFLRCAGLPVYDRTCPSDAMYDIYIHAVYIRKNAHVKGYVQMTPDLYELFRHIHLAGAQAVYMAWAVYHNVSMYIVGAPRVPAPFTVHLQYVCPIPRKLAAAVLATCRPTEPDPFLHGLCAILMDDRVAGRMSYDTPAVQDILEYEQRVTDCFRGVFRGTSHTSGARISSTVTPQMHYVRVSLIIS